MEREGATKGTGKSTLHEKGTNDDSKPPQDHSSNAISGDPIPTHPECNAITVKEEIAAADTKEGGDTGSANGADVVNKPRDKEIGQEGNTGDSGKVPSVKADCPGTTDGEGEDTRDQGSKTQLATREDNTIQTRGTDSDCRIESTRPTDTADEGNASGTVMNATAAVGKSEAVIEPVEDRGVGMEGKRIEEEESSDDDDGDGFRIVVGREAASSTAGPSAPTKRFLPGTNTLVNASINSSAGSTDSRSTSSSKPVSAAAGIASLVPSTGTPVTSRPALKPGEYPPTAELQQSNGKTAFDVDIDGLEEQPWRHPGVDIADFFNYGFTEESWRVYCEKQLRNRHDQTAGRAQKKPGSGRGDANSLARYVGAAGARRGVDQRHGDLHNSGPGRPNFAAQGPPGSGWASGSARERYVHGFGNGPPSESGRGNASPTWFDGPQQLRPGNRANFTPGPTGIGQDRAVGGVRGAESSGAVRRSLSPDPRGSPNGKMHKIR